MLPSAMTVVNGVTVFEIMDCTGATAFDLAMPFGKMMFIPVVCMRI